MYGAMGGRNDDRGHEDTLVREHLPLVHYLVAEMSSRIPAHVSRDDLESAGMAGLAQAARSYDGARGVPFDRFASRRIRGALLDELRSRDWATRSVRASARAVHHASDELSARLGRAPSATEIAAHLDCDVAEVQAVAAGVARANIVNYESLFEDGTAENLLPEDDSASPDNCLLERERQAYLVDAVASLPDRLRQVVMGYFFEERSMHDLGAELGVTDSRISQMRAEALTLLREGLDAHLQPDAAPVVAKRPGGRVARRKDAYFAAIGDRRGTLERLAAPATLGDLLPA
ncbi:MAG: polymerase sigma factor FliA [Actinomycetota bacterium]